MEENETIKRYLSVRRAALLGKLDGLSEYDVHGTETRTTPMIFRTAMRRAGPHTSVELRRLPGKPPGCSRIRRRQNRGALLSAHARPAACAGPDSAEMATSGRSLYRPTSEFIRKQA